MWGRWLIALTLTLRSLFSWGWDFSVGNAATPSMGWCSGLDRTELSPSLPITLAQEVHFSLWISRLELGPNRALLKQVRNREINRKDHESSRTNGPFLQHIFCSSSVIILKRNLLILLLACIHILTNQCNALTEI